MSAGYTSKAHIEKHRQRIEHEVSRAVSRALRDGAPDPVRRIGELLIEASEGIQIIEWSMPAPDHGIDAFSDFQARASTIADPSAATAAPAVEEQVYVTGASGPAGEQGDDGEIAPPIMEIRLSHKPPVAIMDETEELRRTRSAVNLASASSRCFCISRRHHSVALVSPLSLYLSA